MQTMVQFPAMIERIATLKDGSVRLVVDTRELQSDEMAKLFSLRKAEGWLLFAPTVIEKDDLDLPALPRDPARKKSQAQRMKAVIYRLWEKAGSVGDFEVFYTSYTEKIIEQIKEKLN